MSSFGELMQGMCMTIDAGHYTKLSESMNAVTLNALMNDYYEAMFPTVKTHQGLITDVIGGAMLVLWSKPVPNIQLKQDACHAALKINVVAQQFNQSPLQPLPTRLGLYYSELCIGNVRAINPYQYLAVSDIINKASDIESLNKLLGTSILVSSNVIEGVSGFTSREIGVFILKDKSPPVTIFELIGKSDHVDPKLAPLLHAYAKALRLFKDYQWAKALKAFLNLNKYYPNDGPTIFYVRYLHRHLPLLQEYRGRSQKPVIDVGNISESEYLPIDVS
jgi:adenylate cyclase